MSLVRTGRWYRNEQRPYLRHRRFCLSCVVVFKKDIKRIFRIALSNKLYYFWDFYNKFRIYSIQWLHQIYHACFIYYKECLSFPVISFQSSGSTNLVVDIQTVLKHRIILRWAISVTARRNLQRITPFSRTNCSSCRTLY